nr:CoA transferase [Siccirubricoccus sp. G192]
MRRWPLPLGRADRAAILRADGREAGARSRPFRRAHGAGDWPALREELAAIFRSRTRDDWAALFEGTDACIAPVLDLAEAPAHPHNAARGTFQTREGAIQPAPAPRFSRTPATPGLPPPLRGEHTEAVLRDWGFAAAEIATLQQAGAIPGA